MVVHDLLLLENGMIKAEKDIKKLRRINVIEGIIIGYLVCKIGNEKEEAKVEDKVKEKCRKIFGGKR